MGGRDHSAPAVADSEKAAHAFWCRPLIQNVQVANSESLTG